MKVIELYIMRRALGIFTATLFWVLAIVWTTQVLTRIDIVTGNGQSASTFFELAWLVLPAVIPVVMPFAIGIAVAHTLTTMNTDSEMVVISAAGSPRMTVIRPILLIATVACILSFVINNFVEPYSRERLRVLVSEARAELITTVIQEGSFQKLDDDLYMQIGERLPDGRFGGIFLADSREQNVELLYYAKTGAAVEVDGQHILVMEDGVVHRKASDGDVSMVRYKSYAFDLSQFDSAASGPVLLPKDRPLGYLMNPDPSDKRFQQKPQSFRAELHRRFSEWLYPLVFALIGLAVAGDARSFREARIHPLLTTMTIALLVRWAGFFASNKAGTSPFFIYVVYAVPILASLTAVYFIMTNRVMELPTSLTDRAGAFFGRVRDRLTALRLRLSGFRRPAREGRS
ncbi:LPS export ABC transporter permease LptF [Aquamicrobium sp. LC103]|uniref:LPS export ABC transporter permease LptF n=1 Tax=Aquamicrobium sp. LC103 TaxID=1120658 RepID=UPI00063EC783|nr:LPS export ABC transporter permease LptF [Aquamicrobium sp. LC103]TKT81360.1 LPS export ABC transporter permease LptF [Aquamicrobium sp. LC103]